MTPTPIDLRPADRATLEYLRDGRVTPTHVARNTGYARQTITNSLTRLADHGYVVKVETGLYELVDDPEAETNPQCEDADA